MGGSGTTLDPMVDWLDHRGGLLEPAKEGQDKPAISRH
jgi:hypothetical protein